MQRLSMGDNGEETVDVFDETAMAGLGNVTATPFSVNPPHGEVSIPKGIDMVWVSIADKKIYRANIKFSPKIQNKLLKAFREGFYSHWRESNMDFNEFNVTILLEGHLWLYLGIGNLRRVLICDTLRGEETHMTLKEFSEGFYNAFQTVDSLCSDEKRILSLTNTALSMTRYGHSMHNVLIINLTYNLRTNRQSYARDDS